MTEGIDLTGLRGWGGWFTGFAIIAAVWRGVPALIKAFAERNASLFAAYEKRLISQQEETARISARMNEMQTQNDRDRAAMQRQHDEDRRTWEADRDTWAKEKRVFIQMVEGLERKILAQSTATGRLLEPLLDRAASEAAKEEGGG